MTRPDYKGLPVDIQLVRVSAAASDNLSRGRLVWLVTFTMPKGTESDVFGSHEAGDVPREPCPIGHVSGLVDAATGDPLVSFSTQ